MSKLEALMGKNHLSYSALDSYLTCGERFRLERIESVKQEDAWWFIGGSAFHHATELLDTGVTGHPGEAWDEAWSKELLRVESEFKDVRAGGRATKQWPDKENHEWWIVNGLDMTQKYVDWRNTSGWDLLSMDDGKPAVEVPFEITLGEAQVKGYIDRIFVNPDGEAVLVDLKTGSRTPAATTQLGIYALGVDKSYGFRPIFGSYFMARKGELSQLSVLNMYSEDLLTDWFAKAKFAIEHEVFIPHVTSMCTTCSVAKHCYAVGGTPPNVIQFRSAIAS